jgi:hypothetical protein
MNKFLEVNTKAKPYNPAEELIGIELLLTFHHASLIGSHDYIAKLKPTSKPDVLVSPKTSLGIATLKKWLGPRGYNWNPDNWLAGRTSLWENDKVCLYVAHNHHQYLEILKCQHTVKAVLWNADISLDHAKSLAINVFKIGLDGFVTQEVKESLLIVANNIPPLPGLGLGGFAAAAAAAGAWNNPFAAHEAEVGVDVNVVEDGEPL